MREYGIRTDGGHIVNITPSRHVAVRELAKMISAGAKNTYLVQREVTEWEPSKV